MTSKQINAYCSAWNLFLCLCLLLGHQISPIKACQSCLFSPLHHKLHRHQHHHPSFVSRMASYSQLSSSSSSFLNNGGGGIFVATINGISQTVKNNPTVKPLMVLAAGFLVSRRVFEKTGILRSIIDNEDDNSESAESNEDENLEDASDSTESRPLSSAMVGTIGIYKNFISPLLPPACRFLPTCSQYGVQAIEEFGAAKGVVLISWRLLRCSPIGGRGYDPPKWPPVPYGYSSW